MKYLICLALLSLSSCTINVKLIENEDETLLQETISQLVGHEGSLAIVRIAGEEFPCQLVKVDEDILTLQSRDAVSDVPVRAVSQVTVYHGKPGSGSAWAGALIGGATGALLATALSEQTTNFSSGAGQRKVQVGSAIAGGLLGVLAVQGMGSRAGRTYELNPKVKRIALDKKSKKSVGGLEAIQQGVFRDLKLGAGEQLLKLSVYQYGASEYLIAYETHDGREPKFRWEMADEAYVQKQRAAFNTQILQESKANNLNLFQEQNQ